MPGTMDMDSSEGVPLPESAARGTVDHIPRAAGRPYTLAVLLLFVGSGCAALMYEVVWFQLLELAIGSSAVSMGVLLGTFMGGMCLGSALVPRVVSRAYHPLRVYALLELGIGIIGLLALFCIPLVGGVYASWAPPGSSSLWLRGLVAAAVLLAPTLLMGATLPAVSRFVEATPSGAAWLGMFYGGNTAGAVLGSLLAGFYLLRVYDVSVTTYVAVALNVGVALLAVVTAFGIDYRTNERAPSEASLDPLAGAGLRGNVASGRARTVYVAAFLSGLTALAAEVLWTRMLSLMIGATVYTFSLILAVFLAGLGIGSGIGASLGRVGYPRRLLAWCQAGLCLTMAWSAYMLTQWLPYWPLDPAIAADLWRQFQRDLLRCAIPVLPAAILWGASFPLALAGAIAPGKDPALAVGDVYAANTLGAIVGSLGTSLFLVVWIGSQHAQQLLIVVAGTAGLLLLLSEQRSWLAAGVLVVTTVLCAATVRPIPGLLVAYGRNLVTQAGESEVIYVGEGWTASVAVSEQLNGVRNYHNAGKVQASSEPQDMRLQRMLGHLTTLVPVRAREVLVIGCGAGVTAGAVSIDPTVERETIAEIEPLVPKVVSTYFGKENFDVVKNPKVTVRLDDARHFLTTTSQRFDAITSDPLDPWVKGAAMLYTREFFELAKAHLNPGGVVTLFVQLYESNTEAVKSEIATFFEAFPKGMVFANTFEGAGYDLVLLAQVDAAPIDVDAMDDRLDRPEFAAVKRSLAEIGMNSALDLLSTYVGSAADLAPWLSDAQINRDRNLRLQYLAGRGLNLYEADAIYTGMLAFATDPDRAMTGSRESMAVLRERTRLNQRR